MGKWRRSGHSSDWADARRARPTIRTKVKIEVTEDMASDDL